MPRQKLPRFREEPLTGTKSRMSHIEEIKIEFSKLANQKQSEILQRFFKTGKGQYGEGDIFLGIKVPEQRKLAKKFSQISLEDIQELLSGKIHEHRMVALFIIVNQFKKSDEVGKKKIFDFYLNNTKNINNWDLVDLSAPNIMGEFLKDKDRKILYQLANSTHLWEKRISILSTYAFIKNNDFNDAIKISEMLLNDKHDLIHKAAGWMLREVGKKDVNLLRAFLDKHSKIMPRTMLRYAIEKFPEKERKTYLNGKTC